MPTISKCVVSQNQWSCSMFKVRYMLEYPDEWGGDWTQGVQGDWTIILALGGGPFKSGMRHISGRV